MAKKTRNRLDFNQIARKIVDQATSDLPAESKPAKPKKEKDPAAVARGRKGGIKGGKALAAKLTPAQRKASAKRAADKRWGKA